MRYAFILNGRKHVVDIQESAEGPKYSVEGQAFEPKVKVLGKGRYQVTVGKDSFEFTIQNGTVLEGPRQMDLEVRRERPVLERKHAAGRKADGRVKPPMPGKVVEVKVKEGQQVKAGDVLCVLEAMKMQNDLKAATDGTVTKVHVKEGANVEATTVLVEIEAAPQ